MNDLEYEFVGDHIIRLKMPNGVNLDVEIFTRAGYEGIQISAETGLTVQPLAANRIVVGCSAKF